ncbi:MAG TPA: GH3 auxin-responsive promoter family protein [Opitutaceae bacterium]|nr:GH3 auxin-responsive promoter family protein [Opitutaceae bacterium]
MAGLTSSLLALGAKALSARTRRALRRPAAPAQWKIFSELLGQFAGTEFGRANSLTAEMSYERFRAQVPLRSYEQFLPFIEKMKRGAADILWPGRCSYFAISSGTTAGRTKYLPVTPAMIAHFRQTGLDSLLYYSARRGSTEIFKGKHLFLGGSTALVQIDEAKPHVAYAGDLSGITALEMPKWVDRHLYEPGLEIAQLSDWPEKIAAITRRTAERDIRVVAGIPSWLLILAEALKDDARARGKAVANLQQLWPKLECLIHGGVPIEPYRKELQSAFGASIEFHEVYPASEGFIAAQDADAAAGLRLMTSAGIFYEFLPLKEYDENRLAVLGPKAIPLEAVQAGVDYVLLLTTPAGLCRYVIGDVVRFVSKIPPRLIYVGRTKLQLSAFGEHVIEKELTDALAIVCQRHGWTIAQFHVAPLFVSSLTGQKRGRHEWWIELKSHSNETPRGPLLATELDAELIRLNDDYEAKRKGGGLEAPVVRLVMPGVFEKWMRERGKWGGQNKMPRCRSDREIADGLAELTRFAADQ